MNELIPLSGVIFDFNGTLVQDTPLHEEAWRIFSTKLRGKPFSAAEIAGLHGQPNSAFIKHLIGPVASEVAARLAGEKEALYREICKTSLFSLTPGVEEFLAELNSKNIPIAIATSSEKDNLDFFVCHFKLERWFKLENIIFYDGSFPGKPNPDIYHIAALRLGLSTSECVVFEDASSGIIAASRAHAGKIVSLVSTLPEEINALTSMTVSSFRGLTADSILNRRQVA